MPLLFLLVTPEGDLLLLLLLLLLLPFLLVIPEGDLLLHFQLILPPANLLQMPPREYHFWVYILSSRSRNLYVGMTNDIHRRVIIHREARPNTHTAHYNIHRLVHCEYFRYVRSAITREKELKRWTRAQKIELIERTNPTWEDILPLQPL